MQQVNQIFGGINSQCQIHKKEGLIFASLNSVDLNPFFCSTCAVYRHKKTESFVSISDILTSDQNMQPIQNWPPGIGDDHIQFLMNKQTEQIKYKLSQGILDFYENLSNQINTVLNESKKQQLSQLDICFDSEDLIELYNKLFKRKELVEIFENFNAQSNVEYKKLLESMTATSEKDLEILSSCINKKKLEEIKFREYQDNSIKFLLKKLTSILNDQSLILFKSDENDIMEKYDVKIINQELIEEIEKESSDSEISGKEIYDLEKNFLFLQTESHLNIGFWSDSTTFVTNVLHEDCSCFGMYPIDYDSKLNFKLTFINQTYFENFGFGFLVNKYTKSEKQMQREFWNRVIQLMNERKSKSCSVNLKSIILSFTINLREKILKVESQFFEEGITQELNDIQSENIYNILFELSKDCQSFEISEFSTS